MCIDDDQVDAMTQALSRLRERKARLQNFEGSMRNTGELLARKKAHFSFWQSTEVTEG